MNSRLGPPVRIGRSLQRAASFVAPPLDVVGFDTATPLISDAPISDAPIRQRGAEMHLHLVRVAARPKPVPRPAKVIALDARREARLETARPERQPTRPAA
jgi:hypothetical protein